MVDSANAVARIVADQERRLSALERGRKLVTTSLDGINITVHDEDGNVRSVIGLQEDGTYTSVDYNGPTPPSPSAPKVEGHLGAIIVTWDGTFLDAAPGPFDFSHVEVHVSLISGFTPTSQTQVATYSSRLGGSVTLGLAPANYYVRLVTVSTSGVESVPSGQAMGVPTDVTVQQPSAPTQSPPLTVYGTVRGVIIQADSIAQGSLIDYHMSATQGFTPSPTTLWGTTASTVVNIESLPDGSALATDVTYYFRTVAHNVAGVAAASSEFSGQVRLNDDSTIASLTVSKLVSGDMIGAFALLGALQVGNITITPLSGIIIPQPDGGTITLPADGSAATVTADLVAYSLTLLDNLIIRGKSNEVSSGATLYAAAGVSNPLVMPNAEATWPITSKFNASYMTGLFKSGNTWVTGYGLRNATGGALLFDTTTGSQTIQPMPGKFGADGGVTKIGTTWYALGMDWARRGDWYIYKFNETWVKTGESYWGPGNRYYEPVIGNDGTNVLVASVSDNNNMYVRAYTVGSIGGQLVIASGFPINTGLKVFDQPTGVVAASADFGGQRYLVAAGKKMYIFGPNGNRWPTQEWPSAYSTSIRGFYYDGTRFYSMDEVSNIYSYSRNLGGTHQVSFTWYDNDPGGLGVCESMSSPERNINLPSRSWLKVSTRAPADTGDADAPNSVRIYVRTTGTKHLQTDLGTGVVTATYDVPNTTGVAPPTVNGFVARLLSPGKFLSSAADDTGSLWQLSGDGSARLGPISIDNSGKLTKPIAPPWYASPAVDPTLGATETIICYVAIPTLPGQVYRVTASGDAQVSSGGDTTIIRLRVGGTTTDLNGLFPKGTRVDHSTINKRSGWFVDTRYVSTITGTTVFKLTGLSNGGNSSFFTPELFVERIG